MQTMKHLLAVAMMASGFSFAAHSSAVASCSDYPEAGVDWSGCRKRAIVLSGSDLTGANLKNIDLNGSDLRDGIFDKVNFSRAMMTRVNASKASMKEADLSREYGGSKFEQIRVQPLDFF